MKIGIQRTLQSMGAACATHCTAFAFIPTLMQEPASQIITIVSPCSLDGVWLGVRSFPAGANASGDLQCINSASLDINVPYTVNISGCGALCA